MCIRDRKDPRIGFVTITAVEVTPDLHLARVYFTTLGEEKARRETEKGLMSSVPFLRRELGRKLRMRYVPDLLFQYDTSLDYGNRIDNLLRDLHTESDDDSGNTEDH